ncbi:hypothetical protein GCM10022420_054620 [Streptomyces iranensis]
MRSSTVQAVPGTSRDATAEAAPDTDVDADGDGDVDGDGDGDGAMDAEDVAVDAEEAAALVPTVARVAVTNRPDIAAINRNRPRLLVRRAVLTRTSLKGAVVGPAASLCPWPGGRVTHLPAPSRTTLDQKH